MAIEPPARFAVIGAGPIGLEAALYARYLGFEVAIYEQGEICEHVRRWSHVELVTPFRENSTPLGRQALRAQTDGSIDLPAPDAILTAQEWLDRYLLPLADTDLLVDSFRLQTRVTDVSRLTYIKTDVEGPDVDGEDEERRDEPLRVMSVDAEGKEAVDYFDAVIDASGVLSQPLGIGPGGAPAIGERAIDHRIGRIILREDELAALPRGAQVLLMGTEFSAARQIAKLAEVAARDPEFRCLWISRGGPKSLRSDEAGEPYRLPPPDGWALRRDVLARANDLVKSASWLTFVGDVVVEEIQQGDDGRLNLRFAGREGLPAGFEERQSFDRVQAFVGYRPDLSLLQECQIRLDAPTDAPVLLSTGILLGLATSVEGMKRFGEVADVFHPESDLYLVGAKSFGRLSGFLLPYGHGQIQRLFGYIGERADLDLYARAAKDEGPEWKGAAPG
jgi:hypothetical protein